MWFDLDRSALTGRACARHHEHRCQPGAPGRRSLALGLEIHCISRSDATRSPSTRSTVVSSRRRFRCPSAGCAASPRRPSLRAHSNPSSGWRMRDSASSFSSCRREAPAASAGLCPRGRTLGSRRALPPPGWRSAGSNDYACAARDRPVRSVRDRVRHPRRFRLGHGRMQRVVDVDRGRARDLGVEPGALPRLLR